MVKIFRLKNVIIIILAILLALILYKFCGSWTDRKFLSNLTGEIVYTDRDSDILNIYKISANGTNKKLIYHNSDPVNSNSLDPVWSKDGSKIYFEAMKNGEWSRFSINSDGSGIKFIGYDEDNSIPCSDCKIPDKQGIFADRGNLYYRFDADNKTVQVFHWKFYDEKFNEGAGDGSNFKAVWSPDKKFIVFQSCGLIGRCNIVVANKEGTKVAKLTSGTAPDWKY